MRGSDARRTFSSEAVGNDTICGEQVVGQRCLAVVDVGKNANIADISAVLLEDVQNLRGQETHPACGKVE